MVRNMLRILIASCVRARGSWCVPEIKWKSFTETKPDQEYLAVA